MQASTLRPGLLVSLKTSIRGNVSYRTVDLERDHLTENGERRARWETERTIADAEEHKRAVDARSLARSKIQCVCANSGFGLLCPESKTNALDAAVAEARAIVNVFNSTAGLTRLEFNILAGRIAPDDVEAIRAINSEMTGLIDSMAEGLRNLDVSKVREAANKAQSVGAMLSDDAKARVQAAIDVARKAARQIVKAGEEGAVEIDRVSIARITEARVAFLDMDEQGEMGEVADVGRALDFEPAPEATPEMKAAPVQTRMFEL